MERPQFLGRILLGYATSTWNEMESELISIADTLAKKHRRKYGETITSVDKELTVGLIASFGMWFVITVFIYMCIFIHSCAAYNMLNWGVSKEMAKTFSYEMAGRNNISTHDIAHVEVSFLFLFLCIFFPFPCFMFFCCSNLYIGCYRQLPRNRGKEQNSRDSLTTQIPR